MISAVLPGLPDTETCLFHIVVGAREGKLLCEGPFLCEMLVNGDVFELICCATTEP